MQVSLVLAVILQIVFFSCNGGLHNNEMISGGAGRSLPPTRMIGVSRNFNC